MLLQKMLTWKTMSKCLNIPEREIEEFYKGSVLEMEKKRKVIGKIEEGKPQSDWLLLSQEQREKEFSFGKSMDLSEY